MNAEVLDIGYKIGSNPVILGVHYDLASLVIPYDTDFDGIELDIIFDNPRGFRCLDEGDLLNYWENDFLVKNWMFEIKSGGWMDQESQGGGFLSKELGFKEFMICGVDYCVNILSSSQPIVKLRKAA